MIERDTLYVVRKKSESRGEHANLAIKMDKGMKGAIARSRESGVESPYIIHRQQRKSQSKEKDHYTQVTKTRLNELFRYARDSLPYWNNLKSGEKPSWHEIRALGAYLLKKCGNEKEAIQKLIAHKDAETTDIYLAGHEALPFVECESVLDIDTLKGFDQDESVDEKTVKEMNV